MLGNEPIRLILARHGNTFEAGQTPTQVGARTDLPLTDQGRTQAQHLADFLASENVSDVHAGSLKRQRETAQIIAKELHIEDRIHLGEPALTEIDYGFWEGLTTEEILRRWPDQYAGWTQKSQWAEEVFFGTLQEYMQRIEQWLDDLRSKYSSGDTVVGVTSNGVIRLFYSFEEEWNQLQQLGQMEKLKVKTGHFCELLLFKDTLKVKSWNLAPQNLSVKF